VVFAREDPIPPQPVFFIDEDDDPFMPSSTMRFDHLTSDNGLSDDNVIEVFQDHYGFMWFGTAHGLNKYDGYDFTIFKYNPHDDTTLSDNYVTVIHETSEGVLWIGTANGLNRYDRQTGVFERFQHIPNDDISLIHNYVSVIYEDRLGRIWIGTRGGLSCFNPLDESFVHYQHGSKMNDTLSHNYVKAIYEDGNDILWVGTIDGLNYFDVERGAFVRVGIHLTDQRINAITETSDGNFWVGTANGLNLYDFEADQVDRFFAIPNSHKGLSGKSVNIIFEDIAGDVWIGTQTGGLNRMLEREEGFFFEHYTSTLNDHFSLSSNSIQDIFEDQSGVLWIATDGGGVNKFDRETMRFGYLDLNADDSVDLPANQILSISEGEERVLWIGTRGSGLIGYDRESGDYLHYYKTLNIKGGLNSNEVTSVWASDHGIVWLGTNGGGLNRLNTMSKEFRSYTHQIGGINFPTFGLSDPLNRVTTILVDNRGFLWVGTYAGLNRFDPYQEIFLTYLNFSSNDFIATSSVINIVFEDSNGLIWIGTRESGVYAYNPVTKSYQSYQHNPIDNSSLSHDNVYSIIEDENGFMWVGTAGGLNRFDPESETFSHYWESDGLPSNMIFCVMEDANGNLWLSTDNGISQLLVDVGQFKNFSVADGLQGDKFSPGACCQNDRGEMFFGGVNGVNIFDPRKIENHSSPPDLIVTEIKNLDEIIREDVDSLTETIELPFDRNNLSFEFSVMDFSNPGRNSYAYMLEGVDRGWVEAGTRRYVQYQNLKWGDYTFRVKGANSDGVWNEEGISVKFRIATPFWGTLWFRLLMVVMVFFVGAVVYRLRIQSVESQKKALAFQVDIRTQELKSEINQRMKIAQALRDSEQKYRNLVENANSLILLWNIKGEIRFINRFGQDFFQEISGYKADRYFLESLISSALQDVPTAWDGIDTFVLDPDSYTNTETEYRKKTGERVWIAWTNKPIYNHFGQFNEILSIGFDQTKIKEYEELRAEQAERMAVEAERNRIARDLHDAVTQTLFSASLLSEVLPMMWDEDQQEGREMLKELGMLNKGALAEMRTLLLEMRPSTLKDTSYRVLLNQIAEAFRARKGIPVEVNIQGSCELPDEIKLVYYRIAQEAMNNIAKHANAKKVIINFLNWTNGGDHSERQISLNVIDDGNGFDNEMVAPENLGLQIMRERAESINAELEIVSKSGLGTSVQLTWKG
jgi:PAS domain S-box-containing protein